MSNHAVVQEHQGQELSSLPPEPTLDVRGMDQAFPGILDGIGILAGAANVIMQLSHAPIGYGVMLSKVENGSLFKHPVKRARTTITYLAVALVGSREEKLAYRKAVNGQHAQVRSGPDAPVKYNAFNPDLQLWVASCIYWGYKDSRAKLRGGPMTPAQDQAFYEIAQSLGTTLQVRAEMWP
ncbi:MAG: oxygenase MpaB family protein, partial [Perlucidibaca sp.]